MDRYPLRSLVILPQKMDDLRSTGGSATKTPIEDFFVIELSEIVVNRHTGLIRIANAELVTLFWKLGQTLNNYSHRKRRTPGRKSTIQSISTRLTANYGRFFIEKNLRKMELFFESSPAFSEVSQLLYFLSWEHILLLLQVRDSKARQFYLTLKIKQGLSVKDLQRQISVGLYDRKVRVKGRKESGASQKHKNAKNNTGFSQIPQPSFELMTLNDRVMQNVFKEPMLFSFRRLMEYPKGLIEQLIQNRKEPIGTDENLFIAISRQIEEYKRQQNGWLNAQLNLSFWEIGKRINQEILAVPAAHLESKIRGASKQLVKEHGKSFTEKQLYAFARFAAKFPDAGIASWIAHIASWEHILVLLSLEEVNSILYYVRLIQTSGLSVSQLRNEIVQKNYEHVADAKKVDHALMHAIKNPVRKTTIVRNTKSINRIETIDYQFDDIKNSRFVINVFKSLHFIKFVSFS